MKTFFYLSTCSSCKRIVQSLNLPPSVELQDIKKQPISEAQLDYLYSLSGSYEALFSKRAQLYKQRNLKLQNLTESDYKKLILEHYTFLKRPVLVIKDALFIGNNAQVVQQAFAHLHDSSN